MSQGCPVCGAALVALPVCDADAAPLFECSGPKGCGRLYEGHRPESDALRGFHRTEGWLPPLFGSISPGTARRPAVTAKMLEDSLATPADHRGIGARWTARWGRE